jgi:hypothetical protein
MKFKYSRPSVNIRAWLVSKEQLKKVYDFFSRKYNSEGIDFTLETKSGNNRVYDSFAEFENDLDEIKSLKEEVRNISIGGGDSDNTGRTHSWLAINFNDSSAIFFILGEDNKSGKRKNWIDGTYEEIKRIAHSFEIESDIKDLFIKEYGKPESYRIMGSNIIEDFWGEKKERLKEIINNKIKESQRVELENSKLRWWEKSWFQAITLVGAVAGIVGLYFIFK